MSDIQRLRAVANGVEKIVALWRTPTTGAFADLYGIAKGAVQQVEGFQIGAASIATDARRSSIAKQEDTRDMALERLSILGGLQTALNKQRAAVAERGRALSAVDPYRDGDASTVHIDLALATQLMTMEVGKRHAILSLGEDERLMAAVLRLPHQLTGITEEAKAKAEVLMVARKHPVEAEELASLSEAVSDAQDALRNAWKAIAPVSGAGYDDQARAAGASAHDLATNIPPVVFNSIDQRIAAPTAGNDATGTA